MNDLEYEILLLIPNTGFGIRVGKTMLRVYSLGFCGRCRFRSAFETFRVFGKFRIYSNKFIRINNDKSYFAVTL